MTDKVYILLGSNLGDREKFLNDALISISNLIGVEVIKTSGFYNSPAMEMNEPAPDFLNQAVEIKTSLSPLELLRELKKIEAVMGRTEKGNYKSRNIDLDILFFGNEVIDSEELTIPQSRFLKRPFALIPLDEIAPEIIHPKSRRPIKEYISPGDRQLVTLHETHAAASR
ncbi:MAG TPA: 2-amino-4-hydroxy-6-hydroxymethyldihydropteridine diphosphokinase [candidate division Zixibacteria bacterium]|nr:2-amino-4-hydroxy-6-hydroxymethyldihydropteridine diphosphokinase [candidate division Zixibacteria bacterium]